MTIKNTDNQDASFLVSTETRGKRKTTDVIDGKQAIVPMALTSNVLNAFTNITDDHIPILGVFEDKDLKITFKNYDFFIASMLDLDPVSKSYLVKKLYFLTEKLGIINSLKTPKENIKTTVTYSYKEFVTRLGLTPSAREKKDQFDNILKALALLKHASVELKVQSKRTGENVKGAVLFFCDRFTYDKRKGIIEVSFAPSMANHIISSGRALPLPHWFWTLPEKKPLGIIIAKYLIERYTNIENRRKGTHDIVSVRALLDICVAIDNFEEKKDEHVYRNTFQKLHDILKAKGNIDFHYCHAKKVDLSIEENRLLKSGKGSFDIDFWKTIYICIDDISGLESVEPLIANAVNEKQLSIEKAKQREEQAKLNALTKHELNKLKAEEKAKAEAKNSQKENKKRTNKA